MSDDLYKDVEGITRRQMVLFFLVDTSSSMEGTKISSVNTAVREVIPELQGVGGADVELKIAVLEFSSGCQWQNPSGPVAVDGGFSWSNLSADGVTDMGAAFLELEDKLSRKSFLQAPSASLAPVIILMSDGMPTDDWKSGLAKLKSNNWFKSGVKAALAIGSEADSDVLCEFTGSQETVISVNNPGVLREMIKKVSVTSSQIGSRSRPLEDGEVASRQDDLKKEIESLQEEPDFKDANTEEGW